MNKNSHVLADDSWLKLPFRSLRSSLMLLLLPPHPDAFFFFHLTIQSWFCLQIKPISFSLHIITSASQLGNFCSFFLINFHSDMLWQTYNQECTCTLLPSCMDTVLVMKLHRFEASGQRCSISSLDTDVTGYGSSLQTAVRHWLMLTSQQDDNGPIQNLH